MTVGELLVKLGADFSQYNKDLAQAEKQAKAAGLRIGDIFRNALSFTLGIGLFEAIRRGFQSIVGEAVNFNAMMEQAQIGFTTMLGSAEKAQAFLQEMADFAAKTPFEYPDLLEAAKRMMAMGFAAHEVLPTLQAVGDAAAGLGLGKEGINRITIALGQMRAKAKVSAEEMMQLTEAGIPAWEILAEAMGKSTAEVMKLSEKGFIPASQAIQILIEGMEKRFPKMMENMQDTWEGVTSTIKDVWRMTIGALTSNLFKGIVSWLQKVRDFATEFYNTFRQFGLQAALAKSFGPEFTATVNMAVAALQGFWNTAKAVLGTIARYWAVIKPIVLGALAAFLSFRLVNWVFGLAAKAVAQFTFITAVMRGEAVATSGILNFLARAVQIYRLQLHLASMAGVQHIGILQALRIALYSVWSALGPLGWAILGISAVVTAGIILWGKYAASVERANLQRILAAVQGQQNELADTGQQVAQSSGEAADALKDQADATKKAGKEAGKNIQSFDEVHQIIEDTADAAKDVAAGLGEMTMPTLETPGAMALPGIDTSALEQVKPTLAGFWEWIKQGFYNAWESIKNAVVGAWQWIVNKTRPIWEPVSNFFKGLWDGIKAVAILAWEGLSSALSDIWQAIKNAAIVTWNSLGNVLSTTWQAIANIGIGLWQIFSGALGQIWNAIQITAQTIWEAVKNYIISTWNNIQLTAITIWNAIGTFLNTIWNNTLMLASIIWQAIRDLILGKIDLRTAVSTIWVAIQGFLAGNWSALKTLATTIWTAIAQFITTQWALISQLTTTIWTAITTFLAETWATIREATAQAWELIKANILMVWDILKASAVATWEAIKAAILTPINYLKGALDAAWAWIRDKLVGVWGTIRTAAWEKWEGVKDVIKGAINGIIAIINKFIRAFNRIEIRIPRIEIPFIGTVGGWSIRMPQIPEIPYLAEGGLVTAPTLTMLGERGPEAVIPLSRSGFADDLASAIYQAAYSAIRDAMRVVQAEGATQREIILEIDGKRLGRAILPGIIAEAQRTGIPVVLRSV
ncbi:tape measure domain-containing protein [Thermanaeromonas toyohensis ToBE]|uniref:Tape measure domain-containing protein n=2 Tax=Thermanaeromonas TaxID=202949 RepID=A0A1W1VWQ4_9FIRM|nr:tape measure domain-containing protein [Thermanaeromonas toyohensis ToBE]